MKSSQTDPSQTDPSEVESAIPKIPKGREEVQTALINAAAQCFAKKGIRGVSIREIAAQAQVNHGLIHRHFGSKEGLLSAVLKHLSQRVDERLNQLNNITRLDELLYHIFYQTRETGLHWRVLTHALMEGMSPQNLQPEHPVFERLMSVCLQHDSSELEASARSTLIFATGLGFLVFQPYLQNIISTTGQDWEEVKPLLMKLFLELTL